MDSILGLPGPFTVFTSLQHPSEVAQQRLELLFYRIGGGDSQRKTDCPIALPINHISSKQQSQNLTFQIFTTS